MNINFIIGLSIFIYLIIQFFMALIVLLRYKNILILTERNEMYRAIIESIIFLALWSAIFYKTTINFLVETPIYVILILLLFGGLQMSSKKIKEDAQLGIKNINFIKYSWIITRFSGILLIGTAAFCLSINMILKIPR